MLFIAITSGPRFALVGLWYLLTAQPGRTLLPKFVAFWGIFRTLTCGGWTYVTSTDDHGWHDIFMISYMVATIPWMFGCLALSPPNAKAIKFRRYIAGAFFGAIVPMVYFFIQHKVHRIAGGRRPLSRLRPLPLTLAPLSRRRVSLARLLLFSANASPRAAYTTYAFFEWSLVLFDVAFDAVTALDFDTFEIMVKDVKGISKGYVQWLPK